jgi:hypothetical protein
MNFIFNNTNNTNNTTTNTNKNICSKYNGYPSFTPTINTISINNSITGYYTVVYINGTNFLPPVYGNTYVKFRNLNNLITFNLLITFYSSFNISFIVPINAPLGNYYITVVNIYNGNFSPGVNISYTGTPNYSNSIQYTIS